MLLSGKCLRASYDLHATFVSCNNVTLVYFWASQLGFHLALLIIYLFIYFYGTLLCFSKCIVNLLWLLFFEASNKYHDFGLHLTPSSSIFTFVERKIALELEAWGFTCICFVENNEKLFLEVKENLKERTKIYIYIYIYFFFWLSFGKRKDR